MILIGENVHIISKSVRSALESRDEIFINNLIEIQKNMDYVDLNIGPARGELSGVFEWLVPLVENAGLKISFDTTNSDEMLSGLIGVKNSNDCFINSTSLDMPKFEVLTNMAVNYGSNLVALTMSKDTGIPKTSDGRLEIAFEIYEKCIEKGIDTEKIFFDPLVLPVCADQPQALESLNTIRMIKESFDPPVKTIIGLSNISNRCLNDVRPLINRVYAVLAYGAGLDAVIMDAKDTELVRIFRMLESNKPQVEVDNLYLTLAKMSSEFSDFKKIDYDVDNKEQASIVKTVEILTGQKIYSHSFTRN